MRKYFLKRLVNMIITFCGVICFMLFVYLSLPGNYVSTLFTLPVEDKIRIEHLLHLDQPKIVQFKYWVTGIFTGNLGYSFSTGQPVWKTAMPCFLNTFIMFTTSLFLALLLSIPISIISASKPHSFTDNFWTFIAFIGISIPPFVLGAILTKVFTFNQYVFNLEVFKIIPFKAYADLMNQHILPFTIMTFSTVAIFIRYLRSSMLEVIHMDYVKTARAKGLKEKIVLYRHCLKNALLPVLTVLSGSLPGMISSLLLVEIVFNYQGLGTLMINSVHDRDYPLVMAFTIILAVIILVSNFIMDIVYSYLDPRIRLTK
jgi:peptide/nickel transport system permease protein